MTDKPAESELDGLVPSDDTQQTQEPYFAVKDQEYVTKLRTLLKKLRRYRWLYFHSSDYYERIDDYFVYYPTILFGMIISALSLITASSDNSAENYLSYTVAVLGIIISGMREIQTHKQFNTKKIKFETAGIECHILIAKVNHEIEFPDEDPYQFVSEIENHMIKIITDLYFKPPNHLVLRYNTSESDDTSSDDIEIGPKHTAKKAKAAHKTKFNRTFFDYDIEDALAEERKSVQKQKKLLKSQIMHQSQTLSVPSGETTVRSRRHSGHQGIGNRCISDNVKSPLNSFINLKSDTNTYYRNVKQNKKENIEMDVTKNSQPETIIKIEDEQDSDSEFSVGSNLSQ